MRWLVAMLLTNIFLPIVMSNPEFWQGGQVACEPNAGVTYVDGTVFNGEVPQDGNLVVFSTARDGAIVASIQAGPHPGYPNWAHGFFSHILSSTGPRGGTWYFWIVNQAQQRISIIVPVVTDAQAGDGKCQQAHIFFRK